MKTLYVKTYGCQMNEYDSSRIIDLLRDSHQLTLVDEPEQADLLVVNTCSVREKPENKGHSEVGRWRGLKQKRPNTVIAVAGCVASQEGEAIVQRAPYVDLVFGPQTIHRLPAMLEKHQQTKKPVVDITFPAIEKFDNLPDPKANGPTAFVSIMEGCNKFCSFCIVPYTRGKEINRPLDDIIAEVVTLVRQGVREITLLGQNVNAYRGAMHDGNQADLALLITYLAEIEPLARLRFTTSHPLEFSENLIEAYSQVRKLVNHLHLPVQSGSDKLLARMKRGHTALEFKAKIRKLRAIRPDIAISSDFIVGFPGETDQDFQDTLQLVEDIQFDHSYSFIYSQRPGTPAASYPDDVPLEVKKQRLEKLQQLLNQQARTISKQMQGTIQPVLVSGYSKKDPEQLMGRTENNRIVNFSGPKSCIGDVVSIEITEVLPNSLRGTLV